MTRLFKDPLLGLARIILMLTMGVLMIGAVALSLGIAVVIISPSSIFDELATKVPNQPGMTDAWLMAGSFALIIVVIIVLFMFVRHLLRIVNSVAEGDPFIPINAQRLTTMAWLMLAVQVLSLPIGALLVALTKHLGEDPGTVDVTVDPNGIILVITLFILARVFRHGTALRDDLEGTV